MKRSNMLHPFFLLSFLFFLLVAKTAFGGVLFSDDFSSNRNAWYEQNTSEVYISVQGGHYLFEHKRDFDAWFAWQTIYIDDYQDFEISTTLTRQRGIDNYGTGLFWGASDLNNRFSFLITANGYYTYLKFTGGQIVNIIDWTTSYLINTGMGATNRISVKKTGNTLNFYINGSFVNSASYESKYGDQVGFEVDNRNLIYFDDFVVIQNSPEQRPQPQPQPQTYQAEIDRTPPEIVITSNELSRGVKIVETSKKINVRGIATDKSGIVEVLVNGREASLDASGNFSSDVFLGVGENKIIVSAMDSYENRSAKEFTVHREGREVEQQQPVSTVETVGGLGGINWYSRQYAIVVGIDHYKNSGIPSLENAVNDAKGISSMLREMNFTVYELYDKDATKKNIMGNFKKVRESISQNDSIIFYFAGHGQGLELSTGKKTGYIIPYDSEIDLSQAGVIDYDEEAISLSNLRQVAEDLKARHIALLLDSCFSGLAMKRSLSNPNVLDAAYYNDILSRRAINILTAGDDQPVSDGSGHSPFAKAVLQALKEKGADINDRDGYVTFGQLSTYVKEKVEKATSRRQRPQFDNLIDDDGDFLFRIR